MSNFSPPYRRVRGAFLYSGRLQSDGRSTSLFRWSFKWLAIIDLVFTLLEIASEWCSTDRVLFS
jgi:hypothetical protein